jgi:hypothetical protein
MTTSSSIKVKADAAEDLRRSLALTSVFANRLEVANMPRC